MTEGVSEAIARASYEFYVRLPDGRRLPQSSAPEMIERMLRLLDVPEGGRVLEVGTGSGFSTAVLSQLVGAGGSVSSVDIDPDVVTPAWDLLRRDGRAKVRLVIGDGRLGHRAGAPSDRLVAWASAEEGIPQSSLDQVRPDGIIVAPPKWGLEQTVVRSRIAGPGVAIHEAEIAGSFIPLTATPFHPSEESRRRLATSRRGFGMRRSSGLGSEARIHLATPAVSRGKPASAAGATVLTSRVPRARSSPPV